ncbi:hypothetical protein BG004_004253 [Podila humilis]|nr:hypothetical protein BG004_004253 [Podila humilis]
MPCPKAGPKTETVVAYGSSATGVGSRIGGHEKWGGKELLLQESMVAVTDEYRTSQVCPFCFGTVQQEKSRRLVGTEIKTRKVHGSVQCRNKDCMAFKLEYATRPRDSNAALNILISAMSVMKSGGPWPIAPFARYARPSDVPTTSTSQYELETITLRTLPRSAISTAARSILVLRPATIL